MTVHRLAFGLYGQRAGTITRTGGRIELVYDEGYLDAAHPATPLSLSMPLGPQAYTARHVTSYLSGLLPDHQDVRDQWARQLGVRAGDTIGMIAAIGRDCAGGAVFAREEDLDDALTGRGTTDPITDTEIAGRLRSLRASGAAWPNDEHWSLAGGQGKFTLARTATGWGIAHGAAASTHIVKPGITRISHQALAEHVTMRALAVAGLPVAPTEFTYFEDQPAIIVTRYDRREGADGTVSRIHQEDLLQALALTPRRKYESDGGPGIARIVQLLRSVATDGDVDRFVQAVVGNYLVGAPDGHAKNYSLLLAGPRVQLAPLYDVSTGLIPDATGRLRYRSVAQSIGGEKRLGEVEEKHWTAFAGVVGRPPEAVLSLVREMAQTVPAAFADAVDELDPALPGRQLLADVVLPSVRALAEQTLRGLSSTRRVGGRVVRPFLDTISAPGVAVNELWDRPE